MSTPLQKETRITLLMGGPGSERDVSLSSAQGVLQALQNAGFTQVTPLEVADTQPQIPAGTELCYNMIHGIFGEDGGLQAYLEAQSLPYTGAGLRSSTRCFDKVQTKKAFTEHHISSPAYEVLTRAQIEAGTSTSVPLPCVVKPPKEGSSFGVHIVKEASQLAGALADVARYGEEILVEEFIEGKELTVSILNNEALPIIHICPRSGFYDLNNKYPSLYGNGGTDYICPAELDAELSARIQEMALQAHKALGVEVYSRVDVLLDKDDIPYVLEINTIPGMTPSSLFPKAAAAVGISYEQLCIRIAELSLQEKRD